MRFLFALFALLLLGSAPSASTQDSFDAAIRSGNFFTVNEWIIEQRFPIPPASLSAVGLEAIDHRANPTTAEALKMIADSGGAPATLGQLIAYANGMKGTDKRQTFVAFGSSWHNPETGETYVPYVDKLQNEQKLGLMPVGRNLQYTWAGYRLLIHRP